MKKTALSSPLRCGLGLSAAIIVADQISKWIVFEKLLRVDGHGMSFGAWLTAKIPSDLFLMHTEAYQNIVVAPFFNIIMVWNKGVSFGLFASDTWLGKFALVGVAILVSAFMAFGLYKAVRYTQFFAFSFIIGGAIGNIIDRLRFGAVADFVDIHVAGYHWPAFNLADSMIVIGAILLVADALLMPEVKTNTTTKTEDKA